MRLEHITHKIRLLDFKTLCEYFFSVNGFKLIYNSNGLPHSIAEFNPTEGYGRLSRALFYVFVCTSLPTFKKLCGDFNSISDLFSRLDYDILTSFLQTPANYFEITTDSHKYKEGYINHVNESIDYICDPSNKNLYIKFIDVVSSNLSFEYIRISLSTTETVLSVYSKIPQLQLGLYRRVNAKDQYHSFMNDSSLYARLSSAFISYMTHVSFYEERNYDTVIIKYIGTCMDFFISSWYKSDGLQSVQRMTVSVIKDDANESLYISDIPVESADEHEFHYSSADFKLIKLLEDINTIDDKFFALHKDRTINRLQNEQSVSKGTVFASIADFALSAVQYQQIDQFNSFLKNSSVYSNCAQNYSNNLCGNTSSSLFGSSPVGNKQNILQDRDSSFQNRILRYRRFISNILNGIASYTVDNIHDILCNYFDKDINHEKNEDSNVSVFSNCSVKIMKYNGGYKYFISDTMYDWISKIISCYERLLELNDILMAEHSSLAEFWFLYSVVEGDTFSILSKNHITVSSALDYLRSTFWKSQQFSYSATVDKYKLTCDVLNPSGYFYLLYVAEEQDDCLRCLNIPYSNSGISCNLDYCKLGTGHIAYTDLDAHSSTNKEIQSLYNEAITQTFILPSNLIASFMDVYDNFLDMSGYFENAFETYIFTDNTLDMMSDLTLAGVTVSNAKEGVNTQALLFACNQTLELLQFFVWCAVDLTTNMKEIAENVEEVILDKYSQAISKLKVEIYNSDTDNTVTKDILSLSETDAERCVLEKYVNVIVKDMLDNKLQFVTWLDYFLKNIDSVLGVIKSLGRLLLPVANDFNIEWLIHRIDELYTLVPKYSGVIDGETAYSIAVNLTEFCKIITGHYKQMSSDGLGGNALTGITIPLGEFAEGKSFSRFKIPYLLYHCAFYLYYLIHCSVDICFIDTTHADYAKDMKQWVFYYCLPCISIFSSVADFSNKSIGSLIVTSELSDSIGLLNEFYNMTGSAKSYYTMEYAFLLLKFVPLCTSVNTGLLNKIGAVLCASDLDSLVEEMELLFPGIQLFYSAISATAEIKSVLKIIMRAALLKSKEMIKRSYLNFLEKLSGKSNMLMSYIQSFLSLDMVSVYSQLNFITSSSSGVPAGTGLSLSVDNHRNGYEYNVRLEAIAYDSKNYYYNSYVEACMRAANTNSKSQPLLNQLKSGLISNKKSSFYHIKSTGNYFSVSGDKYYYYLSTSDVIVGCPKSDYTEGAVKFMMPDDFYKAWEDKCL